jgi:hypothetical protein
MSFKFGDSDFQELLMQYVPQMCMSNGNIGDNDNADGSNNNLQLILRDYLKDYWRHTIEKHAGNVKLWEAIIGTKRYFQTTCWQSLDSQEDTIRELLSNGISKSQVSANSSTPNNKETNCKSIKMRLQHKTRWQRMAEVMFGLYLKCNFDAREELHLRQLYELSRRARRSGDVELYEIIANYFQSLQPDPEC